MVQAGEAVKSTRPGIIQSQFDFAELDFAKTPDVELREALEKWVRLNEESFRDWSDAWRAGHIVVDPALPKLDGFPQMRDLIRARVFVRIATGEQTLAMRELMELARASPRVTGGNQGFLARKVGVLFHRSILSAVQRLAFAYPATTREIPEDFFRFSPSETPGEFVWAVCRESFQVGIAREFARVHEHLEKQAWVKSNPKQYDLVEAVNAAGVFLTEFIAAASSAAPFTAMREWESSTRRKIGIPEELDTTSVLLLFAGPELVKKPPDLTSLLDKAAKDQTQVLSRMMGFAMVWGPDLVESYFEEYGKAWAQQIQVATLVHRMRTGRWPESMEELVRQRILPSIPSNPVTREPFTIALTPAPLARGGGMIRDASGRVLVTVNPDQDWKTLTIEAGRRVSLSFGIEEIAQRLRMVDSKDEAGHRRP
jgi:hypothetical protein